MLILISLPVIGLGMTNEVKIEVYWGALRKVSLLLKEMHREKRSFFSF